MTAAAIIALIEALPAFAPEIPAIEQSVETAVRLIQSGEPPSA